MTNLRRLEHEVAAWRSFGGIARASRTLAAAQSLQWEEHRRRVAQFTHEVASLLGADTGPDPRPPGATAALVIGTDLGLCGSLNASVARAAATVHADRLIVVGRRLEPELERPEAVVLPAPTSFSAVQSTTDRIVRLLDAAEHAVPLSIVAGTSVTSDGTTEVRSSHVGAGADKCVVSAPPRVDLAGHSVIAERLARLVVHARIVQALTDGAAVEWEARYRTMGRAHDAAQRRIAHRSQELRKLRQEVITQEMLEARRGAPTRKRGEARR